MKTLSLRSNSVTRQVNFNRTKIGGKCQSSNIQMRHFESFSNNVIIYYLHSFWTKLSKYTSFRIYGFWRPFTSFSLVCLRKCFFCDCYLIGTPSYHHQWQFSQGTLLELGLHCFLKKTKYFFQWSEINVCSWDSNPYLCLSSCSLLFQCWQCNMELGRCGGRSLL